MTLSGRTRRILYVERAPYVGGSTLSLFELIRGLDQEHFEPVVLSYYPTLYAEKLRQAGTPVHVLHHQGVAAAQVGEEARDLALTLSRYGHWAGTGYRYGKELYLLARRDWPLACRLSRLIRLERVDLVHSNNTVVGSRAVGMAARLARVPHVCHVRMLPRHAAMELVSRHFTDAFVYNSKAVEQAFVALGMPAERGRVIYNPIDSVGLAQAQPSAALRREFGLAPDTPVISNVGRICWWKGQDDFLLAVAKLVPQFPRIKALIVGGRDERHARDRLYSERLVRLVSDLSLRDHVLFTGFREDVAEIMATSDIIVHSASEPEPFGRVVAEAMLAARPVVATAAGGVLEIVEDRVTGCLVPPRDPVALAQTLCDLLRNPGVARAMGRRAQLQALDRYSVWQHVAQVQGLYQELLDGAPRSRARAKGLHHAI